MQDGPAASWWTARRRLTIHCAGALQDGGGQQTAGPAPMLYRRHPVTNHTPNCTHCTEQTSHRCEHNRRSTPHHTPHTPHHTPHNTAPARSSSTAVQHTTHELAQIAPTSRTNAATHTATTPFHTLLLSLLDAPHPLIFKCSHLSLQQLHSSLTPPQSSLSPLPASPPTVWLAVLWLPLCRRTPRCPLLLQPATTRTATLTRRPRPSTRRTVSAGRTRPSRLIAQP